MGSPTFWLFLFFNELFLASLKQGLLVPEGLDLPMVQQVWGELKLCAVHPEQPSHTFHPKLQSHALDTSAQCYNALSISQKTKTTINYY